jgi:M6 family metalloprotease-like protein
MKKNLLAIIFFAVSTGLFASPARPVAVKLMQPDGQTVEVFLRGDEKIRWMESPDGYTLLRNDSQTIVYATLDADGNLVPSDIAYSESALRSSASQAEAAGISKNLCFSAAQITQKMSLWNEKYQNPTNKNRIYRTPAAGGKLRNSNQKIVKAICVLMQFTDTDKKFTFSVDDFNRLMNEVGYNVGGDNGSVRDFYLENSYGQLDMEVTIVGPFTSKYPMEYYGKNDASEFDVRPWDLAEEAAKAAFSEGGVDPADFDNDGDGYIDAMHMIYAGYGEEGGADANTIWAHEAWFSKDLKFTSSSGKTIKLDHYSCSPELNGYSGASITHLGVICHELGHIFGAPDYYDIDGTSSGGEYKGTGLWDLMANGSWNGPNQNGACPAHINMYQKIRNGWVQPDTLKTTGSFDLPNAEQFSAALILPTPTKNEYFVLENRQRKGFDSYLPGSGHGMIIYHASLNDDKYYWNEVNMGHPQRMYPVCASATVAIPTASVSSYGSINSAGCPFPGASANTAFSFESTPKAATWANVNALGEITDISENDGVITFLYTDHSLAINQLNDVSRFSAFPNPVSHGGKTVLKTGLAGRSAQLSVYNMAGQKISEQTVAGGDCEFEATMPKGLYIIRLTDGLRTAVGKITIE